MGMLGWIGEPGGAAIAVDVSSRDSIDLLYKRREQRKLSIVMLDEAREEVVPNAPGNGFARRDLQLQELFIRRHSP